MGTTYTFAIVVAFLVGFPIFWSFVVYLISFLSGWSQLAAHYKADHKCNGSVRKFQSLQMKRRLLPANYNGCVVLGVEEQALCVSLLFMFRPGHPPLRIPFADISIEKDTGLFNRSAVLETSRVPGLKIIVSMRLIKWIEEQFDAGQSLT